MKIHDRSHSLPATAPSKVPARSPLAAPVAPDRLAVSPSLAAAPDPGLVDGEQGVGGVRRASRGLSSPTSVPEHLKIGLAVDQASAKLSVSAPIVAGGLTLNPSESYQIASAGAGKLSIRNRAGQVIGQTASPLRLEAGPDAVISLDGKRYRGDFEILTTPGDAGKVTVVNDVGMEDYLKGVLPAEMAVGWPSEALKAQAVAARTYAAANMGRRADQGFDLFPTVADQVYKGLDSESPDTSAAVDATRGEAMRYQGSLINALFFSSSGGSTDDAKAVWDETYPYIQAKADPDASPNAHWSFPMSEATVKAALAKIGTDVGTPRAMTVVGRTPGGRARWLKVEGTQGSETIDANRFRLAIGQKSTMYDLTKTQGGWTAEGSGYGHGLGLSQWGARARANDGQDYRQILAFYYSGITIGGNPTPLDQP